MPIHTEEVIFLEQYDEHKWMELYFRDKVTWLKALPKLLQQNHDAFKVTNNPGKLEAGDFLLDGRNRKTNAGPLDMCSPWRANRTTVPKDVLNSRSCERHVHDFEGAFSMTSDLLLTQI